MKLLTVIPSVSRSHLVDQRWTYVENLRQVFATELAGSDERDVGRGELRVFLESVVLTGCRWLKMKWVHASRYVTAVVQILFRRDRPNLTFVDVPVGDVVATVNVELPVSSFLRSSSRTREISSPNVAGSVVSHITDLKLSKPLIGSERTSDMAGGELRWFSTPATTQHLQRIVPHNEVKLDSVMNTGRKED